MGFDEMDISIIWQSEECKDWEDATVHVLIHGLRYGTDVFEGIRAYDTSRGSAIFRWREHLKQLCQSAKPYDMEIPYTYGELTEAMLEVIHRNDLDGEYIRPIASHGYDPLDVSLGDNPTEVAIAAWLWGTYLGENTLGSGVDVMASSWRKHASSQIPMNAKTTGLYVSSMPASEEIRRNGCVKAIVLNKEGNVAESPGENIFMVRGGKIYTPDLSQSALDGITHDIVITLVRERGYEVDDSATISRGELSTTGELFFTGSAAEMTPIRRVDNAVINEGTRGSATEGLQSASFDLVERRIDDHEGWFTYVDEQ